MLIAEAVTEVSQYATGGGLIAIAGAIITMSLPILNKILEWREKQLDKRIAFEKEKRKEESEAKLEWMNLIKDMVKATVEHKGDMVDMKEILERMWGYISTGRSHPLMPSPPTSKT